MKPVDPSMNFLHRRSESLDPIFSPKTIAVVGASDRKGSVGKTVVDNLLKEKSDIEIFLVNPKLEKYPTLSAIPKKVDLAVIVIPAKGVPAVISECADLGIPAAIVISAGFKEMGPPGIALEQEIIKHARRGNMRIIGPNCLGVMNPHKGMNATFAADMALKGSCAFISQSGALCTAVLDWSLREKVGFSAFVSIGSMLDVNWGDLIDYFGNDPETKSILIYMESVGDARSFLSAAREVALTKPIILIKAGRSEESAKAAASHTGSLAGSDGAFSAALKRVGILRVDQIAELFSMTEALAKQPRPNGPRLMIVTNAGGPGVIATDALVASGGKLAHLSDATMDALNQLLPAPWSHNNPVDVLGDASADVYAKAIEIVSREESADGILVILTPQDMTDCTGTAEKLAPFAKGKKPILASWMGAGSVSEGDAVLTQLGIPSFEYPDLACKTFSEMWNLSYNLKGIYEVPMAVEEKNGSLEKLFAKVRSEGRTILDEVESKEVLEAYHIPCTPTKFARTAEEAALLADKMGYPVVLKVFSKTITHKTDVGGVKLNLQTKEEVTKAFHEIEKSVAKVEKLVGVTVQPMIKMAGYEIILGSTIDAEFGPVMLFGSGGQLVEVYKDRALAIPPLTTTLARRMMEETKIYEALHGVRGRKAVDMEALEKLVVQFSRLVVNEPWIKECDINPLLVSDEKIIALDARVILHDPDTKEFPRPAIRPYPQQYVETWNHLLIRPIKPEDETLLIDFHKALSKETVRQRYLKAVQYEERIAHERLKRICFNDYDREIALLALEAQEIVGVVRLTKINPEEAVFALIVKDNHQNRGIGAKLLEKILVVAKEEKIRRIRATMLKENFQMEKLVKKFGFSVSEVEGYVMADLELSHDFPKPHPKKL